ncbi:MAG: hypothetical protein ACW97Z_14490 [Candidatus Hodarchaeales archaeon]|jgi:hypothetical protein
MSQGLPRRSVKFEEVPSFAISGFFGGINPNEGSISFFSDKLVPQLGANGQIVLDTVEHEFVANIKMSPLIFKRMAIWMSEHVKRYENMHGEIQIGQQKQKSDSSPPPYYG